MIGSPRVTVSVEVNGQQHVREVDARRLLVDFLRDELGLRGTHVGCDSTNCGACTIHVDGRSVKSCTMFAAQVDGSRITTVEGLSDGNGPGPLQRAFHERHALQCGYCTPGMLMSAAFLLDRNPDPTREEIKRALAGNLCRCTGYRYILEAVEAAARAESGGGAEGRRTP